LCIITIQNRDFLSLRRILFYIGLYEVNLRYFYRLSGFGYRRSGFGYRRSGFGYRRSGFGYRRSGFSYTLSGPCKRRDSCYKWGSPRFRKVWLYASRL
jgi:hypothetical protein